MGEIKTWHERQKERGIGSCEARDEELTELRAKLAQQCTMITNLVSAWQDLQKFGTHEGPCTFGPPCHECGTPSGRCDIHAQNMQTRMAVMDNVVSKLRG